MFYSVIIASTKRPDVLHQTVLSLLAQTRKPDEIILAVPDEADCLAETMSQPGVKRILARRGLTRQLNDAIDVLDPRSELLGIFDDDVELAPDYLDKAHAFFAANAGVVLFDGLCVRDGLVTREESRAILAAHTQRDDKFNEHPWFYGCNCNVRSAAARTLKFDERLPLYSWLFEVDFAVRATRLGGVGQYLACAFIHLKIVGGRVSGRKFGFSQVMNPYYLWRKGTMTFSLVFYTFWLKGVVANIVHLVKGDKQVDRWGRLKGNAIAFGMILRGKVEPERMTTL